MDNQIDWYSLQSGFLINILVRNRFDPRLNRWWDFAGNFMDAIWLMLQKDVLEDYVVSTSYHPKDFLEIAFDHVDLS